MKRRISELLKEQFEYQPGTLQFSGERIEHQVKLQERVRGKFSLACVQGKIIRGIVSSSNSRVTISPQIFTGRQESFSYEADTSGMEAGDVMEGAFTFSTTEGEYSMPYRILVEEMQRQKKELPKMSRAEFARMARRDFGEAYVLFADRDFGKLAKSWGTESLALYESVTGQGLSYHGLEQFLVGEGEKAPVSISLEQDQLLILDPRETLREELILKKDTWGFAHVKISSDAEFLLIEKPEITTEEFVGSVYSAGFMVQKEKLHRGRNFARITVRSGRCERACTVEVRCPSEPAADAGKRRSRQEVLQMMNAYIKYRAGKAGQRDFAGVTLRCLDNYKKLGGGHIFFDLYRIYMMFLNGQAMEAQMLLEEITARKEELTVPAWKGCYLYLTTFENEKQDYVEYVKEEIRELFLANQENWILQWIMFQANAGLFRNDTEKLDAIRRQYVCGCTSPVMYLEAWEILKKEPLMLRTLGEFEIHLLRFCCREGLLDREICGQTAQLASRFQTFHELLYRVLCSCFESYPSKNLLTAICSLLMKGQKSQPEYAKWFELGVRQDVRLAGLYEYYAITAGDLNAKNLPQAVRMYFSYHNTLDYEKKAAIYANIIRNRESDPQTYDTYRPAIVLFLEEQLQEGRINRDLAFLYEAILTEEMLSDPIARGLAKMLYTWEITCGDPRIHHVIVSHHPLRQEQKVLFVQGKAYVQLYSENARLLLEDENGVRYADLSRAGMEKLLTRTAFEEYCRRRETLPESVLLHDCCVQEKQEITGENVREFIHMLSLPQIRESCRRQIQERILLYYAENPGTEHLEEYLREAELQILIRSHKKELMELLVSEGMCDKAYELLCLHGAQQILPTTLVRLCSWRVRETEGVEDALLLSCCVSCFESDIYDETVLDYLMRYFEGPLEQMKAVWKAGQTFLMERFELEEKILVLTLFMRSHMEKTEPIFAAYLEKEGKERICRAYAIWMSYCYFVREQEIGREVFDYMIRDIMGEMSAPEICQLALLRMLARKEQRTAGEDTWLEYLLDKFAGQGMYFGFYQGLPERLLKKRHLHDKRFLEYRTDPSSHVTLHYSLNGEKQQHTPMKNVYEGIFVREFTLFYQDKLTWSLTVEEGKNTKETDPQTMVCEKRSHRGATGKYELINRLAEALEKGDHGQADQIREQYLGQQYLVDELFQIN